MNSHLLIHILNGLLQFKEYDDVLKKMCRGIIFFLDYYYVKWNLKRRPRRENAFQVIQVTFMLINLTIPINKK